MRSALLPRLLVTGFGPFPGAPKNPTEELVQALAREAPMRLGARALKAVVLPTEYRRSWAILRSLYVSFAPDVVVHFGLNGGADAIHLECVGRNAVGVNPDAVGHAPASRKLAPGGPATIASTFPAEAILAALKKDGFPAAFSDDAGGYVCNATLYRSLLAAPEGRHVGLVHVPPVDRAGLSVQRLRDAAALVVASATREWSREPGRIAPDDRLEGRQRSVRDIPLTR